MKIMLKDYLIRKLKEDGYDGLYCTHAENCSCTLDYIAGCDESPMDCFLYRDKGGTNNMAISDTDLYNVIKKNVLLFDKFTKCPMNTNKLCKIMNVKEMEMFEILDRLEIATYPNMNGTKVFIKTNQFKLDI